MRFRTTLFALTMTATLALAQDPPSRVARLNWSSGTVSFQPAGADAWTEATLNYPLTTGDHLYTDSGSRAELHVGSNAMRLDRDSNFGFLNLDDRTVQIRFTEGSLEIRLKHLEEGDVYEVDTPNGAVSLLQPGDYRIDTDPGRDATMVTVFRGAAEVSADGSVFPVRARETGFFPEGRQPGIREANPEDDFDHFTAARNSAEDRLPRPVHVSESMAGYEDLDANGTWRETPDYGWVWAPRVSIGWAPYRVGRWAWVEPWGWTWIDDAPWGFAPFHYGRWATIGGGWAWIPGAPAVRPVYAPALVVFAGGGRVGAGAVAWFPLGPGEVYRPAHTASARYLREVNLAHVTNINVTNVNVSNVTYVNQRSVTVVPQAAFVGARRVHEVSQEVDGAGVRALGSAPPVAPEHQSLMVNSRNVAQPRGNALSRQVVARTPPPAPPVSFESRRQALLANQGRPLAPQQESDLRRQSPDAAVQRAPVRIARPASALPDRQPNRMDSRPPAASPLNRPPASVPAPEPQRPQPVFRPVPQERVAPSPPPAPRPELARPEIQRPVRPEPRPAAVDKPAAAERRAATRQAKEERKEEKKEEKK